MDDFLAYHWRVAHDATVPACTRMLSCRHCVVQVMASWQSGSITADCRELLLRRLNGMYATCTEEALSAGWAHSLLELAKEKQDVSGQWRSALSVASASCLSRVRRLVSAHACHNSDSADHQRPAAAFHDPPARSERTSLSAADDGGTWQQNTSRLVTLARTEAGDERKGTSTRSARPPQTVTVPSFPCQPITVFDRCPNGDMVNARAVGITAGDGRKSTSCSRWTTYAEESSIDHCDVSDGRSHRQPVQPPQPTCAFRTAHEQLVIDNAKKQQRLTGGRENQPQIDLNSFGLSKKSLGTRRGQWKFNPPVAANDDSRTQASGAYTAQTVSRKASSAIDGPRGDDRHIYGDALPELKHIDPKLLELVMSEIMDSSQPVCWSDIAGLEFAKKTIKEIVVLPMLRPDIFTGLRGPPKGLLLFGPPGTGKTLIGKCVASQAKATFFSISASSLTSKWIGEGEKMVRALFAVARFRQPAVIFVDEIDSLLSQRSESEHESSRRIKTEFLVQMDGVGSNSDDRVLLIGATNRPQELDEAARRRFVKRLYIPLPEMEARRQIVLNLLATQLHSLTDYDFDSIVTSTQGYSGADMANLCREAALGPVRDLPSDTSIETITLDQVRPIARCDFEGALTQVRASVSDKDLAGYIEWNTKFGSWLAACT